MKRRIVWGLALTIVIFFTSIDVCQGLSHPDFAFQGKAAAVDILIVGGLGSLGLLAKVLKD